MRISSRGVHGSMKSRCVRGLDTRPGDGDAWLARLDDEGWTAEYGAVVRVTTNGRPVVRYALIETSGADHEGTLGRPGRQPAAGPPGATGP